MTEGPSPYSVAIRYLSNERPYSWVHKAYKVYEEDKAFDWFRSLVNGMGPHYHLILLRDGVPVEVPDAD